MVDVPGPDLDDDTAEHLRRHGIRAVCLFGKNIQDESQLARLVTDLRAVMGEDALIAIDQEGGGVFRTTFLPFAPSAMSLGAANDEDLARNVGRAVARPLAALGINWNFAPVLDLNVNALNPVIGDRAFGADPERVARLASAWLEGSLQEGVAGCVKHFPGHGDTHLDSHLALPRVSKARDVLDDVELAPFRRVFSSGRAPAVMTAHIVFEALDEALPATLSGAVLTELLRDELAFDGVVITDSMGMAAIDANFGRGEAGVLALRAGADMVMALGRRSAQEATLEAIQSALERGEIQGVERRLARLNALAERFRASGRTYPDEQRRRDEQLFDEAWRRGLTAVRGPTRPNLGERVTLIALEGVDRSFVSEAGVRGETLASFLRDLYDLDTVFVQNPGDVDWPALRASGRFLALATTSRHRAEGWRSATPDLHLALWNPYAVLDVNAPAIVTYGYRAGALRALAAYLKGEMEALGTAPVDLR